METHRFDALTKFFAVRLSRRAAARGLGAGLGAAALSAAAGSRAAAQDACATPAGGAAPSLLFVQTFTSGAWAAGSVEGAVGTLTLTGVGPHTVYFEDRPGRRTGFNPTAEFLELPELFVEGNPPNAALAAVPESGDGDESVLVLELLSGTYEAATGSLTYEALQLAEPAGERLAHFARRPAAGSAARFGGGSLFIDNVASVGCGVEGADCRTNSDCCGHVTCRRDYKVCS